MSARLATWILWDVNYVAFSSIYIYNTEQSLSLSLSRYLCLSLSRSRHKSHQTFYQSLTNSLPLS
jgi:hypothetical protein